MKLFIFNALLFTTTLSFALNQSMNPISSFPEKVLSKSGHIYYFLNEVKIAIPGSGKDHDPLLSSDKRIIAFLRAEGPPIPKECDYASSGDYNNADQIWSYDIQTKKERLLVSKKITCDDPKKTIVSITDLAFSPDNKIIYFIANAWAVSGALHAVKIDGSDQHYIIPANAIEVVPKGSYKGYLLVGQHRYFVGGGTYDWVWLFSPKGKEEGPIGEDITKDQMDFLES